MSAACGTSSVFCALALVLVLAPGFASAADKNYITVSMAEASSDGPKKEFAIDASPAEQVRLRATFTRNSFGTPQPDEFGYEIKRARAGDAADVLTGDTLTFSGSNTVTVDYNLDSVISAAGFDELTADQIKNPFHHHLKSTARTGEASAPSMASGRATKS